MEARLKKSEIRVNPCCLVELQIIDDNAAKSYNNLYSLMPVAAAICINKDTAILN